MTQKLNKHTAVVTGAAGFMGQRLVSRLLSSGTNVIGIDLVRPPPSLIDHPMSSGLSWLQKAVESESLLLAPELIQANLLFHLSYSLLPSTSNEAVIRDVQENLLGSLKLIESMVVRGRLKRVILASSGGTIYGAPQTNPIYETHPLKPICSYGVTKLAIEQYLNILSRVHGLSFAALRISNPYGPGQYPRPGHGVVAAFISAGLRNKPLEIWGDGSITRDYIFIDDVIEALVLAANHSDSITVNIGSGQGLSLNALSQKVAACLGYPLACRHSIARATDLPANVLGIKRAYQELGWQPRTGITEGLAQTALWIQSNLDKI